MIKLASREGSEMLVSRNHQPEDSQVKVKNCIIGGNKLAVIAGPCAVGKRGNIKRNRF